MCGGGHCEIIFGKEAVAKVFLVHSNPGLEQQLLTGHGVQLRLLSWNESHSSHSPGMDWLEGESVSREC